MTDARSQLLEATIDYLENLKARGVRFVPVSRGTLDTLQPPKRAVERSVAPTPTRVSPPSPARQANVAAGRPATAESKRPSLVRPEPAAQPVELEMSLGLSDSAAAPVPAPLTPEAKAAAFAELRQRALACVKCPHLAAARRNVVFGVGSIDTELMFVGEAPGAEEDEQGEPFVGRAGELLTKIIQTMGLRREDVYIANVLKCRPDTPGQVAGNRKPTAEEMKTCIPYLHEQIDLIRPKVIVALGGTAMEGLLGKTAGITKLRGHWHTYRGIPLMPTYHTAYLLRNQALSEKRKVWEDMMQVMEKLGLPISEKQRNFFLRR